MSDFKPVLTYNGYDMFEVVSALQKSIRRGIEEEAMRWGVELYISNFTSYAWKRMIVIAMEDIGMANPFAVTVINDLKAIYEEMASKDDKKNQERLPYTQAILFLTHSKKSRICDWAQAYWFDEIIMNGRGRQIPDYALDIHTRRGKRMGKTIEDFFKEGTILASHVKGKNEDFYRDECHRRWTNPEWCQACDEAKATHNRICPKKILKKGKEQPPVQLTLFDE